MKISDGFELATIMSPVAQALQDVRQRITHAAHAVGRDPATIALVAVSKTFPESLLRIAYQAGLRAFGENYPQEGMAKIAALADLSDLEWHFIGALQSNKTELIATHFHWVQSVTRLKIAQRLSNQRPATLPPLNVCIQINISSEESKGGIQPNELVPLAREIAQLPGLKLRGLMGIAEPLQDNNKQRVKRQYDSLRDCFLNLRESGFTVDTLSMGMSQDMEIAITAGTTMLRLGSALFGQRTPPRR